MLNDRNTSEDPNQSQQESNRTMSKEDVDLTNNLGAHLYITPPGFSSNANVNTKDTSSNSNHDNGDIDNNNGANNSTNHNHDDTTSSGMNNDASKRSKSFNKLAEAIGEGLANTMDSDGTGNNNNNNNMSNQRGNVNVSSAHLSSFHHGNNFGLDLFSNSSTNSGSIGISNTFGGGEMNNFQRQSRHAASRLKGKATYANLEDHIQYFTSASSINTGGATGIGTNANGSSINYHHHPNAATATSDLYNNNDQNSDISNSNKLPSSNNQHQSLANERFLGDGRGSSYTASTTLFSSVGSISNNNTLSQDHASSLQTDLLRGIGSATGSILSSHSNALGLSSSDHHHPRLGLSVNEPAGFNSTNSLSNLAGSDSANQFSADNSSNFTSGAFVNNIMDKGILDYMQLRDSNARGSGTGSAPPNFDKVVSSSMANTHEQQRKAMQLSANPTTEAQLTPFLRNPGPDVKPSRCLAILVTCRPTIEKSIRSVCESFGGLEYFRSEFAVSKGVIFLSYFNLQHAQNAAHYLASRLLLNQTLVEPRIRYCTEINGSDETRLLISVDYDYFSPNHQVLNLDETTLSQILTSYGPIRNLNYQVFPGGEECFAVEFYDVMDAKQALLELQTTSHPVLPPIKIQVAGLSPKERKLAKDLLQVISSWRSGSDASSHQLNDQYRSVPQAINAHQLAGAQVSLGSHTNSRSHSPSSMGMHSPVMFPPTPPRTPPIIIQQPGNITPHSLHGSPVNIAYAGGMSVASQSQHQPQTHLIVAPDGQISYYTCTTTPAYGNGQQIYHDQNPQGNIYRNIPLSNSGFLPQQGVPSNVNHDYYSRRPNPRHSKPASMDDNSLQLNFQMINSGQDTRTSLMVKNIPNKYTRTMLLNELQENGFDSQIIDFFYLPIDFKNRCNRGYAFINFVDYRDIVPFWERYHGQHWRIFNSDKICDITYARIQGKQSMLKRFEHSALMEKDEDYQPLVFVSSGPKKGQREVFPTPSNNV